MSFNPELHVLTSTDLSPLPDFGTITEYDVILDSPAFGNPQFDDDATLESTMQFNTIDTNQESLDSPLLHSYPPRLDTPQYQPLCPPDRTPLVTEHNFKVSISSTDINKKKYLYSARLNRVYVDMNCDFPVQFDWNSLLLDKVFVRATMVFSDDENAQKRVERCLQHLHQNNANIPDDVKRHVLRSSREVGTSGVTYHGDPKKADSWFSVRVELNNCQSCSHAYKFVCKNSCNSGINRRSTAIIFTLENEHGYVLGRQMVGVRACSCPRRDLTKDEETVGVFKAGKKRVPSNKIETPKTKKIKLEVAPSLLDDRICNLPPLQVIGNRTMIAGLEMMVHMMEQARAARANAAEAQNTAYDNCITAMQTAIQEAKNSGQ